MIEKPRNYDSSQPKGDDGGEEPDPISKSDTTTQDKAEGER